MINILISGPNGFVGSNIANYLNQFNYKISGLSRDSEQRNLVLSENFNWDELFPLKEFGFNTMIHLAGKAHDLKKTSNEESYFIINTGLTKSLFDVFLQSNSQTFIYFSSVKAVADEVDGILTEDVIPDPQTAYGRSKLKAEEYLLAQKLPSNRRLIILRPCMIHGPGNKGNLNLLYKIVSKGIPYPLAAYENRRSFLCIDNLNFLIKEIIQNKEIASGIYNIADDESLSTNDLVKIISKASGKNARLWKIPKKLVVAISKIGDVLHLPLNSERLKKMTENYLVSNNKIKKALNINKLPLSAAEGLEKTIKSFTENR